MRKLLLLFALATGTLSAAPRPAAPEWDVVPAGVVEALCQRLKMDAVATGQIAIVRVTQPLATPESVAALAGPKKNPKKHPGRPLNRAIPLELGESGCQWQPIDATAIASRSDQMVVELSAPLANPYSKGEAGLFVRVSLGSEHPAWYWISLVPRGEGWTPRFVFVLSR